MLQKQCCWFSYPATHRPTTVIFYACVMKAFIANPLHYHCIIIDKMDKLSFVSKNTLRTKPCSRSGYSRYNTDIGAQNKPSAVISGQNANDEMPTPKTPIQKLLYPTPNLKYKNQWHFTHWRFVRGIMIPLAVVPAFCMAIILSRFSSTPAWFLAMASICLISLVIENVVHV